MARRTLVLVFIILAVSFATTEARKTSSGRSRSSNRGSTSRRTNTHAAPTSFSYPSGHSAAGASGAAAGGTSLFGWQSKSKDTHVQSSHAGSTYQSRNGQSQQSHSYPNSATGLSGNRPPSYEQSMKQSHSYPSQNSPGQNSQNTQKHSYPVSNTGLSGNAGAGNAHTPYSGASAPAYPGGQQARPPVSGSYPSGAVAAPAYGNNQHQGAPPPYSAPGYSNPGYSNQGYGHAPGYGAPAYGHAPGYGAPSYGHAPGYGSSGYGHAPGYGGYGSPSFGGGYGGGNFGGYNYNGLSRGTSTLTKVGIAGAGVGTLLTGLALWNLARSGQKANTYIYQDRHGNPVPVPVKNAESTNEPINDPFLGELVNCTLTIKGAEASEVIGIPCAIATSFSPNSDLNKGVDHGENTQEAKCTITVVTKNGTEFSTTVACSIFLNTAKEAKVTEPPPLPPIPENNGTNIQPGGNGPPPFVGNESQYSGPPIGVPLAPYPNDTSLNQGYGAYAPPPYLNPVPIGVPVGAPLPPPLCKPDAIPDPLNPCVSQSQDLTSFPLNSAPSANSTASAA